MGQRNISGVKYLAIAEDAVAYLFTLSTTLLSRLRSAAGCKNVM